MSLVYHDDKPVRFQNVQAITPSDSTVYSPPLQAIYVGGAGNIALTFTDDSTAVFTAVTIGVIHSFGQVKKVLSTGTTATLIRAST